MKLYGVTHGGSYEFGGFELAKYPVDPAPKLLESIEQLPPNSRVGVEALEEAFEGSGLQDVSFQDEDLAYWEEIIDRSRRFGHSLVYLDSLNLQIEAAKKRKSALEIDRALWGLSDYTVAKGKERDIVEVRFALEAVANYIFKVEREDVMFARLRATRPDLAIIGQAHGDLLMLTPNLATELGIAEYWHGVVPTSPDATILDIDRLIGVPREQHLEQADPDPKYVAEREQTTRWYRAATLGRITLNATPAWIGSWEVNCRPSGLFEVYADTRDDDLHGTIIDSLGTAAFSGHISDTYLRLVKEYDPSKVLDPNYLKGRIINEAEADSDGVYTGTWRSEEQPHLTGGLVIRRGDVLYTPPPISPQLRLF